MTGEYQHTLDSKGRLFIPSKLREKLGETFYVTISGDECLYVYNEESWDKFRAKLASVPYAQQGRLRPIFANAAKCEPDAQGRILLPLKLREHVGLTKEVTVVGNNGHAELWDRETYERVTAGADSPENIAALMMEFDL